MPVAGLMPNLRLPGVEAPASSDEDVEIEIVDGADKANADDDGNVLEIEHGDGSISISIDGRSLQDREDQPRGGWFDNLVDDIDSGTLYSIADELLRGIRDDLESRKDWIEERAQGLKLLGLKIEIPGLQGASDGAPVEGMSKVRHPLLLEAVLRFQANARSELLPTDGPVKTRIDSNGSTIQQDELANALEKDLNHYLTTTASEYYPDTDRMLLMLGFGGSAFKKIYFCPLRGRPVSESVDADDLIVNNAATDLRNAKRVTNRTFMRPSTLKRLQILGVYRDVNLTMAPNTQLDAVQREKNSMQGIKPESLNPEDRDREIYECYCELDLPGFEHKYKGKVSGLEIPYRVTIDVSSREVLSIVRNYDEDTSDLPEARTNFVKYTFVPGIGFYDIGLLHILGNTTNAITAAWRELLDAGMYANFPGFLMADTGARQNTNIFRVPPGGGALVKTSGLPLNQAIMPLPYKEPSQALMALVENMAQTGMRIGGTSEMQVGEGKSEAPVGTTLAMIEQATKVLNAVHKRMHASQAEEFQLIAKCFREHPESFWQRNRKPALPWDEETFMKALDDCNIIPQADPNTASHGQRMMKLAALKQITQGNPNFNQDAIDLEALREVGWSNPEQFMLPEGQRNKPSPEMLQAMAQLDLQKQSVEAKTNLTHAQAQAELARVQLDVAKAQQEGQGGQGGLDPAKVAELALKKQELDIKNKIADAKMMNDQARLANDQAKMHLDAAKASREQNGGLAGQMKQDDLALRAQELQAKQQDSLLDAVNRKRDRESRERLAAIKLAEDMAKNPAGLSVVNQIVDPGMIQRLEANEDPLPNNEE